jgi:cell division protein FtsB
MSAAATTRLQRKRLVARAKLSAQQIFGMRRKIATVAAAVLAFMLAYHVMFGHNGLTAFGNKRHDLHDLQAQVNTLQRENADLQGHVDRLTSDPNAIEHQAREDLHYTRPGEVIYTLAPSQPELPTVPPKPSR